MKRMICERHVSEYMSPATPVVSSRTSVQEALRLARDHGFSALPVCDEGRFLGMVGERDLLAMTPSQATSLSRFEIHTLLDQVTVGAIVKFPPATVALDLPLREAVEIMVKHSTEILPVLENDRFAGIISWKEFLDAALEDCSQLGRCERDA
ncbi:MAG: CBS domain-containing protein [Desulfobacteria bacterium]